MVAYGGQLSCPMEMGSIWNDNCGEMISAKLNFHLAKFGDILRKVIRLAVWRKISSIEIHLSFSCAA